MLDPHCPQCMSSNTKVVYLEARCNIPLGPDGFATCDAKEFDTENEIAECGDCGFKFALAHAITL